MMEFLLKRLNGGDVLWIARFVAIDILKPKFSRQILTALLLFHISLILVEICYHFNTNFSDFIKFSNVFFGMLYAIVSIIGILYEHGLPEEIATEINKWSLEDSDRNTSMRIQRESILTVIVLIISILLTFVAGSTLLIPGDADAEIFFPIYICTKWLPQSYSFVSVYVYRLILFFTSFTMVNSAYQFLYIIQSAKIQVYLLVEVLKNITNVEAYNNVEDSVLRNNVEYQEIIEERFKICIKRHAEILHNGTKATNVLKKWIPLFGTVGMLFCISTLLATFSYSQYLLNPVYFLRFGTIAAASSVIFCSLIYLGQSVEDVDVIEEICELRFLSLSPKILKLSGIITTVGKIPFRLEFSPSVSVNYELGVKLVKLLYSALCILIRFKGILY